MPKARVDVTESAPSSKIGKVAYVFLTLAFFIILLFLPHLLSIQKRDCAFTIPASESGKSAYENTYTPDQCVDLEIVDTESSRAQGLSGRSSMSDNQGMLFVFEQTDQQCIWMKDMNFSLDIIWVGENKEIIDIKRNVSPTTYPESFCVDASKYVIELKSGVATKARLSEGQKLNL